MNSHCRRWRLFLVLALLIPGVMDGQEGPPPKRVYRIGVESSGRPFTFLDPSGQADGFCVALLRAAAEAQGLEVVFDVRPWDQILADFKAGQLDVLGNVAYTPERDTFIAFSIPHLEMRGGLFVRQDKPPLRSTADLAGKRIAVLLQSMGHDYARRQNWGATIVPCRNVTECLEAVQNGRCDALLAQQLVTLYQIREQQRTDIVLSHLALSDLVYSMRAGVHKQDADLLRRLNDGLLQVHARGAYDRLYEKWIGPLEPRPPRWRDFRPYFLPTLLVLALVLAALGRQRYLLRRLSRQAHTIHENEERLSLVFEGSQDGFWDWDAATGHVERSPRWAGMLGYKLTDFAPDLQSFLRVVHPDDRGKIERLEEDIMSGRCQQFTLECRARHKSGEWIWILDRGKIVKQDPAGRPLRVTGTHTDITVRKETEEENERLQHKMIETQKFESLGVLAGGIAHDFNNLLTVILGNTALARLDSSNPVENTARLDKVITAANRAADLCRQLLAYAGKGSFTFGHASLNDIVRETTRLLELSLSPQARLEFTLADQLPRIEADSSQIRQIIMNLVLNASEALGDSPGKIQIATRSVRLNTVDLAGAFPTSDLPAGPYVCLEVSDTGAGMIPEVQARIFDPFFTTKFTGRGLGLASVIGIVRSHRGILKVQSTPGRGSSFRVFLPAVSAQAAETTQSATPVAFPLKRSQGTILVADDEAPVRQLVTDILRQAGYEVVAAADGREAVEVFRHDASRFTATVLDLSMPGLDGIDAYVAMTKLRPGLVGIIISGLSAHDATARFATSGAAAFVQKPFSPQELLASLSQALQPKS